MTRHVAAFVVKWVVTLVALYFVALFFPLHGAMGFWHSFWLSLLIAVVGYATDLYVPIKMNNFIATIVDFVVAFVIVYFGNYLFWDMRVTTTFAVLSALLVAFCEIFFHIQFLRNAKEM